MYIEINFDNLPSTWRSNNMSLTLGIRDERALLCLADWADADLLSSVVPPVRSMAHSTL